jgi:hypothetical protein
MSTRPNRPEAAVNAVLAKIARLHVSAKVRAIDLCIVALCANLAVLHYLGHRFPQVVRENEADL